MSATITGVLAILMFSIGTVLVALSGDIPAFQLTAMVFFAGALTLYAYFKMKGVAIIEQCKAPVSQYAVMLVGIGLYTVLLHISFKSAPAFEINMLNYLWPIFLVLFVKLMKRDAFKWNEVGGMLLGFVGMILIFIPTDGSSFTHITAGHVLVVIAAGLWAFYSALAGQKKYSTILLIPVMLISSLISLVAHLALEETVLSQPVGVWVAVTIFCLTRFSYAMWDYAMREGDQIFLSSLSYGIPLLSSIYFIVFGFTPARFEVGVGGAFIVTGCLVVNMHRISYFRSK